MAHRDTGVTRDDFFDELNTSTCPKCTAEQIDLDGFGVLMCDACGWCSHASRDGGVCGFCGHVQVQEDTTA